MKITRYLCALPENESHVRVAQRGQNVRAKAFQGPNVDTGCAEPGFRRHRQRIREMSGPAASHHESDCLTTKLPRHLGGQVGCIAALASSQVAGTQPFTCDAADRSAKIKSCGFVQGSGIRDEA